ncbi:DUF58 domain-containing protein [Alicyclobacillus acidoterrestris]|uniref:DUF58 domain-containing protein n=1 Tax=Alicyclobacillus TaxID=29330 RepID=UPI001A8C67DD|nr:DUF58 domain-containing protein [Alicyclobacillus suci]
MLTVLWLVIVIAALIWIWPFWWSSVIQGKVDCIVEFPRHECDIQEAVPLTVTLVNRSWLPIPFAEVSIQLPPELSTKPDEPEQNLIFTTYVMMRRRVQITFTLYGASRGPATIRDIVVRMHEGIGIRNTFVYHQATEHIAIRPNPELSPSRTQTSANQGDSIVDRWLYPDETMFKGIRPYQPTAPARHIHWRASARFGNLVTKQFFSSTDVDVCLVLNAQMAFPHWAGTVREPFEELIGYLTDMALYLEKSGANLSFVTNAVITGRRGASALGHMKATSIRSLLGHAQAYVAEPLDAILNYLLTHRHALPQQILVFSAFETNAQKQQLEKLRRSGKHVVLIHPVNHPLRDTSADETTNEKRNQAAKNRATDVSEEVLS